MASWTDWGGLNSYPGPAHVSFMICGFLSGFLLTAIPNFLGNRPASRTDWFSLIHSCRGDHFFCSQSLEGLPSPYSRGFADSFVVSHGGSADRSLLTGGVILRSGAPSIHAAHFLYIASMSLITLLVASRVIVAHGGFGLDMELTSKTLVWMGFILFIAALTRAVARLIPDSYVNHLGYAAVAWVLVLLGWGLFFVPKALKRNSLGKC